AAFREAAHWHQPAYKPGSVGRRAEARRVTAIPLRRRLPGASSNLPGRLIRTCGSGEPTPSLFGLAPGGVCRAGPVTGPAGRSCLTVSPSRAILPYERPVLAGSIPGVAPAGRYPAPYVLGARTFLPGRLSTFAGTAVRPTDTD